MLLKGKNAVITGCLRGIGKATVELFASQGANIWACCQFQDAAFDQYSSELQRQYGVWITPVFFDLTNYEQVKSAAKTIMAAKQPIDILANIAGMTEDAWFHMVAMEQMKRVFEVNFFAPILFTQYITKLMSKQKKGSVINVASISALDGNSGQLSYSSAKAAVIGATKTLSAELAPIGIRVNAIAPGVISTEMTEKVPEEKINKFIQKSDLKRLGLPKEVAEVMLFLATDLSSYITGQVLRVDGGMN